MNHICPLCKSELIESQPLNDITQFACPTVIKSLTRSMSHSHFYSHNTGFQYIYVGNYQIIGNYLTEFKVHKFMEYTDRIDVKGYYQEIFIVPAFEIKSEEHLLNKISNLLVFL